MSVPAETLAANLATVRERIERAGGDLDAITIVAVAKRFDAETIAAAMALGLVDIGESYAQELLDVASQLDERGGDGPRWHFVGRIQRNKVGRLAPRITLWHSVDREAVAEAIARAAPGARVLVQVNATAEPQKAGCEPGAVPALVRQVQDLGLEVDGLMTIGPAGDLEGARRAFRSVRGLADGLGLPERSMGMSDDLEVAVQERTTMVRVGTALFGPRRLTSDMGK